MQFNSFLFLLCFLPVCVVGYHVLCRIRSNLSRWWLLAASVVCYAYAGWRNLVILCSSILVGYLFVRGVAGSGTDASQEEAAGAPRQRIVLVAGICAHVLFLFYFKYLNFTIQSVNGLFHTSFSTYRILLPLGASFYTFQQIAYLVDTYRGETAGFSFFDYLLYMFYFPKLTMGPLASAGNLIPQFRKGGHAFDSERFIQGLRMFNLGLAKKVLFADVFAQAVSWGYAHATTATALELFLTSVGYTMQIYFDFSGYSDMARGASSMLMIDLPMNFDSPYKATSIRDFWKRWHMTLTAFFTKYVYIPLGGNRKGKMRTLCNMFLVFLVSGVWHGASYTFILWGILHALCYLAEEILGERYERIPRPVRWFITFHIVNVLWLLFNSGSVAQWWQILQRIVTEGNWIVTEAFYRCFHKWSQNAFVVVVYYGIAFLLCLCFQNAGRRQYPNRLITAIGSALLLVCSLASLSGEAIFVYFGF